MRHYKVHFIVELMLQLKVHLRFYLFGIALDDALEGAFVSVVEGSSEDTPKGVL